MFKTLLTKQTFKTKKRWQRWLLFFVSLSFSFFLLLYIEVVSCRLLEKKKVSAFNFMSFFGLKNILGFFSKHLPLSSISILYIGVVNVVLSTLLAVDFLFLLPLPGVI
ncbi:Uncharacterized protein TCM_009638 [Theobroma cacao]|uniref:Uncharacterized protein n=1 Tax=Theobroma cacao TaxID=3641 RepID=A0A061E668_THECC|nr:Uncharacterized protein TCM_009638 [Theobroma cacao]